MYRWVTLPDSASSRMASAHVGQAAHMGWVARPALREYSGLKALVGEATLGPP